MIWVPGHSDIALAGNETADKLAKQAVHVDFVTYDPSHQSS